MEKFSNEKFEMCTKKMKHCGSGKNRKTQWKKKEHGGLYHAKGCHMNEGLKRHSCYSAKHLNALKRREKELKRLRESLQRKKNSSRISRPEESEINTAKNYQKEKVKSSAKMSPYQFHMKNIIKKEKEITHFCRNLNDALRVYTRKVCQIPAHCITRDQYAKRFLVQKEMKDLLLDSSSLF